MAPLLSGCGRNDMGQAADSVADGNGNGRVQSTAAAPPGGQIQDDVGFFWYSRSLWVELPFLLPTRC